MEGKGYFMVWGIIEFKAFHASLCLTPPDIIEVSQAVEFLWMYLTEYLLLPSGARYINNIDID